MPRAQIRGRACVPFSSNSMTCATCDGRTRWTVSPGLQCATNAQLGRVPVRPSLAFGQRHGPRLSTVRFTNPVPLKGDFWTYFLDLARQNFAFTDFTPYTPFREIGT
jgi:hypothetical protein